MHRRQPVRRQQAGHGRDRHRRRHAHRPAQHPLADRLLLLARRRHHPAAQALGWILDLYDSVDDIRAHDQTIVYCVHETVGHLGIFVSGSVARKEHGEFASNIDFIDVLPPGLYEAVIVEQARRCPNARLAMGNYVLRFEPRDLDDIACLWRQRCRGRAPVRHRGPAVGHQSRALPQLRPAASCGRWPARAMAQWLAKLNPVRLPFELFSSENPLLAPMAQWAEQVRADRQPASPDNPFVPLQEQVSRTIVEGLTAWGEARDKMVESLLHGDVRLAFAAGHGGFARIGRAAAAPPGRGARASGLRRRRDRAAEGLDRSGRRARGCDPGA